MRLTAENTVVSIGLTLVVQIDMPKAAHQSDPREAFSSPVKRVIEVQGHVHTQNHL